MITTSGARDSDASATAGCRLAVAVPDVVSTATGCPVCCASPSAKKPEQRSSTWTHTRMPGSFQSASASGAERDPGETQACRTPARASSSASAEAKAVLRFVGSTVPGT